MLFCQKFQLSDLIHGVKIMAVSWKRIGLFMEKRWALSIGLLLLAVNLYIFSDGLRHGYLGPADDFHHVHEWKFGQRALTWVFLSNGNFQAGGLYRPFEVLSYMIDNVIWGDYIAGRHVTNFLFHFFNTALVCVIAYLLTQSRAAGFIAGLLFSVHPAHYSAVSAVSGRTDVIGTTFCLLSLVLFAIFIKRKSFLIHALALVAFVCGLLMKELAFIVPLLVLSYELIFSRPGSQNERSERASQVHSAAQSKFWTIVLPALGVLSIGAGVLFSPGLAARYLSNDGVVSELAISWIELIRRYAIILGGLAFIVGVFHKKIFQLLARLPGRYSLSFFFIFALYLPFRMQILGGLGGYNTDISNHVNTHTQISLISFVRDFYALFGLVWPLDYDYRAQVLMLQKNHEFLFWGIFAGAVFLLLIYAGKYAWKHKPTAFTLLMVLIVGMPSHNLIFKMPFYETRYLYLLTVPVCLFIGVQIARVIFSPRRRHPLASALGGVILMIVIFAAGAKQVELNKRYVATGQIMRGFIDAIEKHKNLMTRQTHFVFVTFPFLPIDCDYNIYVTAYLSDAINFAVGESNWKLDDLSFLLFVDPADQRQMRLSRIDSSAAVIENVDIAKTKTIPAAASDEEKRLISIYDPSWRDPHPVARSLSAFGPAAETRDAFIRIEPGEKALTTVTATFNDARSGADKENLFVFYNQGQFEIAR